MISARILHQLIKVSYYEIIYTDQLRITFFYNTYINLVTEFLLPLLHSLH
jgi:hypothetical protein